MYRYLRSILALGALAALALFALREPAWAASDFGEPAVYRLRLFTAPAWCGSCRVQKEILDSLAPVAELDSGGNPVRCFNVEVDGRDHRVVLEVRDIDVEVNAVAFETRAPRAEGVPYYQFLVNGRVSRTHDDGFRTARELLRFVRRGIARPHAAVFPPDSDDSLDDGEPELDDYDPNNLFAFLSAPRSEHDPRWAGPNPHGLIEQSLSPRLERVETAIAL